MKKILAIGLSKELMASGLENFEDVELVCKNPEEMRRTCDFENISFTIINTATVHRFERNRIIDIITDRRNARGKREPESMMIFPVESEADAISRLGTVLVCKDGSTNDAKLKYFVQQRTDENDEGPNKERRDHFLRHLLKECREKFPHLEISLLHVSGLVNAHRLYKTRREQELPLQTIKK